MLFFRRSDFKGNASEVHKRLNELGIPSTTPAGKKLSLEKRLKLLETKLEYMKQAGIDPVTWNVKKDNT